MGERLSSKHSEMEDSGLGPGVGAPGGGRDGAAQGGPLCRPHLPPSVHANARPPTSLALGLPGPPPLSSTLNQALPPALPSGRLPSRPFCDPLQCQLPGSRHL